MKEKIKGIELRTFLKDYETHSTIEFLETGKEKNDLIESAKKRGILVEDSRDLGLLKTIYCFTDKRNSNGVVVPSKEFQKKIPQIIGKPMNKDHDRDTILGYYIDYKYILKENKAITYAVFFKSYHPDEWKQAKKLQKNGKLSSSFEIYADEDKRVDKTKGDYILNNMEIAGGALIYEDEDNKPAFKDAKVLSIAKKELTNYVQDRYLVFASKSIAAKSGDIITADWALDEVKKNAEKLDKEKEWNQLAELTKRQEPKEEQKKPEVKKTETEEKVEKVETKEKPKEEVKKDEKSEEKVEDSPEPEPTVPKVKCSNCEEEIETIEGQVQIKCPKCLSILDSTGKVKYPPQIKDFNLSCTCGISNWLILENNAELAKLRCLSCAKEVNVKFKVAPNKESTEEQIKDKLHFLYQSFATCLQCGHRISIIGTSKIDSHELTCPKCDLHFKFDKAKSEKYRQIEKINYITGDKIEKSSDKGGEKEMEIDKKIVKAVEENEKKKTEEKTSIVKPTEEKGQEEEVTEKEDKTKTKKETKVVVEEAPKPEDTLKKETPVKEKASEIPVEPKTEEKKVSEIKDAPKEDTKIEDKVEKKITDSEIVLPKKSSVIRKAVKKILNLKKDIKLVKASAETKEKELKDGIKKVASQLIEAKAEIKKIKLEADKKIEFYSENAKEIVKRKIELGDKFGKDLSDNDILDNDKFAKAKLEKENVLLRAKLEIGDEIVGDKVTQREDDYYSQKQKQVDNMAFGRKKEKKGEQK